jgi:hypothetical protein
MRGKLQNFAKAAILAITQKNCSIDDALRGARVSDSGVEGALYRRSADLVGTLQALICEYL